MNKNTNQHLKQIDEFFVEAYKEMVLDNKNLDDMKEKMEKVNELICFVLAESDNALKSWLYQQAPLTVTQPNDQFFAFAGDDGRIYINPVFVKAVSNFVESKVKQIPEFENQLIKDEYKSIKLTTDIISYVVIHEIMHIMLGHVFKGPEITKHWSENRNLPIQVVHELTNISMDFVINNFICNKMFSDILQYNILDFGIYNKETFLLAISDLNQTIGQSINISQLKQMIDDLEQNQEIENKTWEELLELIIINMDTQKINNFSSCNNSCNNQNNQNKQSNPTCNNSNQQNQNNHDNQNCQDKQNNNNQNCDNQKQNSQNNQEQKQQNQSNQTQNQEDQNKQTCNQNQNQNQEQSNQNKNKQMASCGKNNDVDKCLDEKGNNREEEQEGNKNNQQKEKQEKNICNKNQDGNKKDNNQQCQSKGNCLNQSSSLKQNSQNNQSDKQNLNDLLKQIQSSILQNQNGTQQKQIDESQLKNVLESLIDQLENMLNNNQQKNNDNQKQEHQEQQGQERKQPQKNNISQSLINKLNNLVNDLDNVNVSNQNQTDNSNNNQNLTQSITPDIQQLVNKIKELIKKLQQQNKTNRTLKDAHGNEYNLSPQDYEDVTDGFLDELKEKMKENQELQELSNQFQLNQIFKNLIQDISTSLSQKMKTAGWGQHGGIMRELTGSMSVNKKDLAIILSNFLKKVVSGQIIQTTWSKAHRRLPGILPYDEKYSNKKDMIVFFDVSASIGKYEVNVIGSSLKSLIKNNMVKTMTIHTFDYGLVETFLIKDINSFNKFSKGFKGRGSTSLLKAMSDTMFQPKKDMLVIVFTDSAIFDDFILLSQKIKEVHKKTGLPVIWFSLYDNEYFQKIMYLSGNSLFPVLVSFTNQELRYNNIKKNIHNISAKHRR